MNPLLTPAQISDFVAIIQFVLAALTLPTILKRSAQVPRSGSIPTAALLWMMVLIFLAGGPTFATAAIGSGMAATGWSLIALLRPVRSVMEETCLDIPLLPKCNGSECQREEPPYTHSADCARAIAFRNLPVDMGGGT